MSFADDVINGAYNNTFSNNNNNNNNNKKKKKTFSEEVVSGTYENTFITKKKEPEKRTWFNSGAFSDGYDFGDITKTLLGTGADMYEDLAGGALNIGEGLIDTGAYAVQGGAKLFKNDDLADTMEGFIKRDLIEESGLAPIVGKSINPMSGLNAIINGNFNEYNIFNPKKMMEARKDDYHEENSFYGDKSDSLIQSAGQLAGTVGLQAVGVPWFVTTGVTSFGSGTEEAYNNGATFGEAGVSAAINAGADILTEKLSGGISFGGKTLDQALTKQISQKISSKAIQKATKLGLDVVGEGTEEVLASLISNVGKKLTYEDEKTWKEVMASEEALDEYLESFIGGAVLGGVGSLAQGGNTTQDIAPVDNTAQIQGLQEQLQAKQQELNQVEDVREKQIIQEEIEILNQELTEATNAQQFTSEEQLKQQRFTVKETEISDNQDINDFYKSVENASVDNSEKAHNFASFVANIVKDKGIKARAVNYDILEKEGRIYKDEDGKYKFIKDGVKTDQVANINGFKENGVLNINMHSPKALEKTVGHELGEFIKDSDANAYNELKQIAIELGKADGTYNEATINKYNKTYQDLTDDVTDEYVNDKLGELFENDKLVTEISKKPNLMQKIISEIKHLVNMAKAGSAEFRKLLSLQHKLENKFKETYRKTDLTSTQTTTDTKQITADNQGRTLSKEQQTYFKDSKVVDENGNLLTVYHGTRSDFNTFNTERTGQNYDGGYSSLGKGSYFTADIDVAKDFGESSTNEGDLNIKETYLNIKNPFYADDIAKNDSQVLEELKEKYDIKDSEMYDGYNLIRILRSNGVDSTEVLQGYGYDGIIGDNEFVVFDSNQIKNVDNTKPTTNPDIRYSLSTDNQGRELSKEQQKYFKDSKAVDENGNLVKVYHGTNKAGFTEFSGGFRGVNYYTNNEDVAKSYFTTTSDSNSVYEGYANITNPLEIDVQNRKWSEIRRDFIADADILKLIDDDFGQKYNVFTTTDIVMAAKKSGKYDGVIFKNIYDNARSTKENLSTVYVTFNSNQFKNADNTKPTANPDIRYSLSEDNQGNTLKPSVQKWAEKSKARDENGNLKVLYHGTTTGEFTVFDKSKASPEGDWGAGFYLTDNEYDVEANYEDEGPDFNSKVERLAEKIVAEQDISYDEARKIADEQLYKGSYKITSYVNMENPAIVGETRLFNYDDYAENYNIEDYESEEDFNGDVEQLLVDDVDSAIWAIEKEYNIEFDVDNIRNILYESMYDGGIEIQKLKDKLNSLYLEVDGEFVGSDVARIIIESQGYDGIIDSTVSRKFRGMRLDEGTTHYIAFKPNQIKSITNENPTDNPDINMSLSAENEIAPVKNPNLTYGEDIKLQVQEAIVPLQEAVNNLTEQFNNLAPVNQETVETQGQDAFNNITDKDIPIENRSLEDVVSDVMEGIGTTPESKPTSPFDSRDIDEVGKNRSIKAYQFENPEVRPFFRAEAENMLGDLDNTIKGERNFNDQLYYDSNGEDGWYGTTRQTAEAIAYLKDKYGYSYDQIRQGLNDIIEDNGKENNAVAKRIEFMLDERLRDGYTTSDGIPIPPNEDYIKFLDEKQITEYNRETSSTLTDADVPLEAPEPNIRPQTLQVDRSVAQQEKVTQNPITELLDTSEEAQEQEQIARILEEAPTQQNKKQRGWAKFRAAVFDKGSVFEDLSLKNKNRELMSKWDYMLTSESRAQNVMMEGVREFDNTTKAQKQISKGLHDIRAEVGDKVQPFSEYLYHKHNIGRMSLEKNAQAKMAELQNSTLNGLDAETIEKLARKRITDKTSQEASDIIESAKEYVRLSQVKNKPVFGDSVTAEVSQKVVDEFEMNNPEFMDWANDVYDYNKATLNQLIKSGVISQETADLFAEMYPHYVPIARANVNGNAINVPLDTNRTGINTPIRGAKGGNGDILPLFDTMAKRTIQTYKAVAKNNFGVELKNTLKTVVNNQATSVDEILDNVDQQESLLQQGENGKAPTFTVFENGEKVTYEITQDMYEALKPVSDSSLLSTTFKPFNKISNFLRGVLTEYNPVFMFTNAIKDSQDILINSQHAAKTYAKIPEALHQIIRNGFWKQEYLANGGEQNSYFDSQEGTFDTERKGIAKILDLPPLKQISQLNNIIEMTPRLAEYIASREAGRSIETSMLDAARVTTNFKAGGDVTKWANRNGATFLNASVQGAMQQVRNIREANAKGLKGYANLASKFALAGIPAMILNNLLWDDDEEYEELSDYVKQSYWIVGKYGDGNFIRIPKGRMITVVQEGLNQMANLATGNDEADLGQFLEIVGNNIAPNNPIESNVLSPIIQAATNTTWYGDDLVPLRLQDEPVEEQFDESTDKLSIFLGQKLGISPYKINYVIDQYSGGIGDVALPMMTQQAETGSDSLAEELLAPLTNKFTVDSVMKNQNVSDLYSLSEELTSKASSTSATDEDVLRNKYINSVKADMNQLYKEKREIQSDTTLSNSEKYEQVREIQEEINEMAKEGIERSENITVKSNYSKAGNKEYYKNNKGEWTAIREEEAEDLNAMDLTTSEKNTYFSSKNSISKIVNEYEDDKDDIAIVDEDSDEYKNAVESLSSDKKKEIVNKVINSGLNDNAKAYLYKKFYNSDTVDTIVKSGINVDDYLTYTTMEFTADKNSKGNSISGSRKNKVVNYVNGLNLSIPQKAILIKSTNTFKFNDYNNDIVSYVDSLEIDYTEKVKILKDLDMTVDANGNISWK